MSRVAEEAPVPRLATPRLRLLDVLVLTNLAVLVFVSVARYFPRFVSWRGAGNLDEFLVYAAALLGASLVAWAWVRRHADLDATTLALVQLGLLLHWLGAFVTVGDGRLYDVVLGGLVRYDKLVHFANGGITVAVLLRATPLRRSRLPAPFRLLVAVLTALGLATLVELVEFGVLSRIPSAGTGGPADGMRDLLAGLLGSICALPLLRPREGGAAT